MKGTGVQISTCYYSVPRKTVKLFMKVVLYLLNCTLCNPSSMYKALNRNWKTKYEKCMHELVMSWISERNNPTEFSSDELQLPEKQPTVGS
jgi:hypothetical protein